MDVIVNASPSSPFFSIWPPVAVNIHDFLFHAIDGFGGGLSIVQTLVRSTSTPVHCSSAQLSSVSFNSRRLIRGWTINTYYLFISFQCVHGVKHQNKRVDEQSTVALHS